MPEIENLETEIMGRSKEIEEIENQLSNFKDFYYLEVQLDKIFTNDKARGIEVKRRLNEDESYNLFSIRLNNVREVQGVAEIRLAAMKREFIRQFCQVRLYGAI